MLIIENYGNNFLIKLIYITPAKTLKMKKILLLISLFILGNTYGQIKTLKGNTFTSSQCVAGGVSTVYYPKGGAYVPSNLIGTHAGESSNSNWKMVLNVDDPDEIWIAAEIIFLAAMPAGPHPLASILSFSGASEFTITAYANRILEDDKTLNCSSTQVKSTQNNKLRFNLKYNGTYANGIPVTFNITVTDPKTNHTEIINVTVNNTLSIDKLEKYDFSFGPNPTKDLIYLSANKSIGEVEIFNLVGQKSLISDISDTKGALDISNLSRGVYIMNVAIDEKIGTYKIIKE